MTAYPISDIPITTPDFWVDEERCTDELLRHVFRSATDGEIPMFKERVQCLREAGEVLCEVLSHTNLTNLTYELY